ncbi:MAG: xanthine dehydrogenase accessory protein XdhC [Robiginitomaculum sp.]|nr:MAG: xanthine dehydrogenase accessory protein XdhC [Robiginitomaculum sp.]
MSAWHENALRELSQTTGAVLVSLADVKGSAPRGIGTQMLVTATRQYGTIGGGALEFGAAARAREILESGPQHLSETMILGPDLGQCCGGQVALEYERFTGSPGAIRERLIENATPPVPLYLFGAGHVGTALVRVLTGLPFAISWVDQRPESFTQNRRDGVKTLRLAEPVNAIKDAPIDAIFIVLTHDHELDYQLVRAILRRGDFTFCGLIGSKTKRARFAHRLKKEDITQDRLDRLTCPIGMDGIPGKAPEAIAVSVAAQLLTLNEFGT